MRPLTWPIDAQPRSWIVRLALIRHLGGPARLGGSQERQRAPCRPVHLVRSRVAEAVSLVSQTRPPTGRSGKAGIPPGRVPSTTPNKLTRWDGGPSAAADRVSAALLQFPFSIRTATSPQNAKRFFDRPALPPLLCQRDLSGVGLPCRSRSKATATGAFCSRLRSTAPMPIIPR